MKRQRFVSLVLVLTMLLTLFPATTLAVEQDAFTDVNAEDWFYDAATFVQDKGLMSGTGPHIFSPQDTMTRGMIVTVLYRMEEMPAVSKVAFTDVSGGQWYTNAVAWASEKEIVLGYGDGTFGPNDAITREQLATILYRYSKYKGYSVRADGTLYDFPDQKSISDYALVPVSWAVGIGLISGTGDHTLSPQGNASRAQVATVLMRYCKTINKSLGSGGGTSSGVGGGGGGTTTQYYTVTFDTLASDAVGTPARQQVRSGAKANQPAAPTRPAYHFTGWYLDKTLQNVYDFTAPVTQNLSLYAGWAAEGFEGKYRVTFDLNNGDVGVYEMQEVAPGGKAAAPAVAPQRELYRFTGWYTEPEAAFLYDFNSAVHNDVTLYAGWGDPDGSASLYAASNTEETVYSITGLEMAADGGKVHVTLNTNRACGLIVDFFADEIGEDFSQAAIDANLSNMPLSSVAIQTPEYGELITVSIPVEETLPERYLARARLVALNDADDVIDLCAPYVDITHTEQFAKFDAQTVADFEPDRVVNFDRDQTTNFGVLQDHVIRVNSTETVNRITVTDIPVEGELVPNHIYTFADPDATVSSLGAGDVVYVENTQHLFKIKTATEEQDGSIVFLPDGNAGIAEYYSMVKMDVDPTYQAPQEQGQADMLWDAEGSGEVSLSRSLTWAPKEWLNVTGSLEGSISLDFRMYYDVVLFGEDYMSCSVTAEVKAELKITLKVTTDDIPLADEISLLDVPIPIPTVPGLEAYVEAKIPVTLKLSGSISATLSVSAKGGFRYDSNSGREDIKDTEIKLSISAQAKAELKAGFKFSVGVRLLKKVLKAEVGIESGVKITATVEYKAELNAPSRHTCALCIAGEAKRYFEVTASLSYDIGFLKGDAFKLTLINLEAWIDFLHATPGKFYISIDHGEDSAFGIEKEDQIIFGGGTCPNNAYRIEFAAENEAGESLSNVPLQVNKHLGTLNTTTQVPCVLYLHDGTYTVSATIDGAQIKRTLVVKGNQQTVHLSKTSGNKVLSGKIVNSENASQAMKDVNVKISQNGIVVTSVKTKADGTFAAPVPAGTFLVEATKAGFIPFSIYQRVESDQAETPMPTIELIAGSGEGGIRGVITDAATGDRLTGVKLELRKGWDNITEGDVIKRLTTNSRGEYRTNTVSLLGGRLILGQLPCGNYTLRASKSGYIDTSFNVIVRPGETDSNPSQDAAMPPVPTQGGVVSGDTYRIVLTWGENPSDLDSHMVGNRANTGPFHVYFGDRSSWDRDLEVCNLDLDDTTSFGPETITLNANTSDPYYYYIHHYNGSGNLPTSIAQIKVYHGTDIVRTFNVPTFNQEGLYWNVFAIVNGRIVVKNTITNDPDIKYAGLISEGSNGGDFRSASISGELLSITEKK